MHRLDIINYLIKKYNFNTYLEIGISGGWVLNRVNAKNKLGVDPDWRVYVMQGEFPLREDKLMMDKSWTPHIPYGSVIANIIIICEESDKFFAELNPDVKFDIVFIDGLHISDQVFRDITNSIKHLNKNGAIVVHDCNPPTKENASTEHRDGIWNGTTYLGYIDANITYDIKYYTVDTDWGCGVMFPRDVNLNVERKYCSDDWNYFNVNRKDLLNLIGVEEFIKIMNT